MQHWRWIDQYGIEHAHRILSGPYDPKMSITCYGCNQLYDLLLWQLSRKRR